MTLQEILSWFDTHPTVLLSFLSAIVIIALIGLLIVKNDTLNPPLSYLYTFLIYAFAIPGILSLILVLYNFFFLKSNLLEVSFITHFVPLITMCFGFFVIHKTVAFNQIPGFGKITGLFILIIITFIITYILQRMFFGILFIGKFGHIVVLFILLLLGLRLAWVKIIKSS